MITIKKVHLFNHTIGGQGHKIATMPSPKYQTI